MAGRHKSQRGTNAVQAGTFLLTCLTALPVLAAPIFDTRCDDSAETGLDAAVAELHARTVSSSENALEGHLLEQRIEAAARSAFADDEVEETESEDETATETPPAKAGGPTASDREPLPFKRQMYRRDI